VPFEQGQSAVVVCVPAVESLVSGWRERFDRSALQGMPAHIAVLYPFLDVARLTSSVMAELAGLCAQSPVLDVEFRSFGRFPAVLYLDPEPAAGLRRLTATIAEHWPEAPPYGGRFAEVMPHLTVAQGAGDDVMAGIERDLLRALPVRTRLVEACLYVFDGARWRQRARLPFRGPQGA
jgi:2'-5' RNA ligase